MGKIKFIIILSIILASGSISSTIAFATDNNDANCEKPTLAITDQSKKVIVIGAGVAGLESAHQLHCKGYNVTIIDANDRPGGRLYTNAIWEGLSMDLGGGWIHGIINNPIKKIADKIGLTEEDGKLIKTDYNHLVIVHYPNGTSISEDDVEQRATYDAFNEFVEEKRQSADKNTTFQSAIDEYLSQNPDVPRDEFMYTVNWNVLIDWAIDADRLSLKYTDQFKEMPGKEVIFLNGYQQIPEFLAKGLTIKYTQEVDKIQYDPLVKVHAIDAIGNDNVYDADYVVSAVPLGVLQSEKITFVPDLNTTMPKKEDAIKNLAMGTMDKVYLKFSDVFWDDDMSYDWINYISPSEQNGKWITFLNLKKLIDQPVLMAFVIGGNAIEMENRPDIDTINEVKRVLQNMYPEKNIEIKEWHITRWANEPTKGSFSTMPIGSTPEDFDNLSKPLNNTANEPKVFFAGEATHKYYFSTVHGAYFSGIRAAEQIQKLDGKLDSPFKQVKYGMHPADVICNDGLELVLIPEEFTPYCLSHKLAGKFVDDWQWGIRGENYPYSDEDSDGLDNTLEEYYYTDPLNADTDNDGIPDGVDNCPIIQNTDQIDSNEDEIGDACNE